jgi:glycosyltransferase involved in cell wall biosynthesis/O-antigen/teichoic acid export membrane protein
MWGKLSRFVRSREGRVGMSTYAAEGVAALGMVIVYSFAARLGKEQLDIYVIVRRTVSFVYPFVLIGAVVGLTRFVALEADHSAQRKYLFGALGWVVPLGIVLCLAAMIAPARASQYVFNVGGQGALILPLAVMIMSLSLHSVAYSYLRGRHRLHAANVLNASALALVPCMAFLLFGDLRQVLWATAIGWMGGAFIAMIPEFFGGPVGPVSKERSQLFRYGLPRLPGDAAMGALLTVPVYVAGYMHGLGAGGQMGLAITLLNVSAAVFSPVGLLLLPASAARIASGDHAGLITQVDRTVRFTLIAAFALLIGFEVLAPWLLGWYLGPPGEAYVSQARVLFLGAHSFAFFVALRSLLDAYHVVPRNGLNLIAALVVLLAGCAAHVLFDMPPLFLGAVVVAALWYLAWRTLRDVLFVRSELRRRMARTKDGLRLVMVIAGKPDGHEFPFARRQASVLRQRFGAEVELFFLQDRMSPSRLWKARRALKRLLHAYRPDLVMVHYGTVTALFTVLSSSVPVVITFHGSDLNATPSDGRVRDFLGRLFSQIAAFFAAGIICVSESLRSRLWWRREEVHVLPMGVDLGLFKPMDCAECRTAMGWREDERIVLFNNNNPGVKRIDIARAAIERVQASGIRARLVALEGAIPPERMPVLMNAADALLLCSDREGSPTMVKEAMACGLPVVTSDVGDVRERLRGVAPGAVVGQDAESLATALIGVLRNGSRSNGRELAVINGVDAESLDARTFAMLRSLIDP